MSFYFLSLSFYFFEVVNFNCDSAMRVEFFHEGKERRETKFLGYLVEFQESYCV